MTDKIKDIINNFSDMKIIKALECCIIGDCDNCPFYETRELCPNLILFVSDLIKRQKAEIEKLKSKNSNLTSDLSSLRNDLSSAKAEIEMNDAEIKELQIALQGYLDDVTKARNLYKQSIEELNQAKAEIERLRKIVGFTPARGSGKSPFLNAVLDNVRTEAYRECVEKINKNLNSRASFGSISESVICKSIISENDELLKELVGEDDG